MKRLSVMVALVLMITVVQAQTLSSFSPASGSPGDHVTLTGVFSLTPGLISVTFNEEPATIITSSLLSLTVAVPPGATTGLISVNVAGLIVISTDIFTVTQPNIITFDELADQTYGDAPFDLTATSSLDLPVNYTSSDNTIATVTDTDGDNIWTVTILGAGSTTITASQPGNNANAPAPDVSRTLVVHKADQFITLDPLPEQYVNDPAFQLTAVASSTGLDIIYQSSNEEVASISGSTVTIIGAGTTTITALQEGNLNYNAAPGVSQTLVVNKNPQTIIFDELAAKTFGDIPFELTALASSDLPVNFSSSNTSVATVSGNTVTITGAGSTTITASQPGNASYAAAPDVPQILVVQKTDQFITLDPLPEKYANDPAFQLTAIASSGLEISYQSSNEEVASINGSTVTIIGVGTTTITASQEGDENYNAAAGVSQTLVVNKNPQTITFDELVAKTFGDSPFDLTAIASSGLPINYTSSDNTIATISDTDGDDIWTVTVLGAGSTVITASQPGNDANSPAPDASQTLVVNKADQFVTLDPLPEKYVDDPAFELTAIASSGLEINYQSSNEEVAVMNGSTVIIIGAGTATITASQEGNENYNAAPGVSQTLVVNKNPQTITFDELTAKTFEDSPYDLTAIASSGLPVNFSSSDNSVATVSDPENDNTWTITIIGAGSTIITASQPGNEVNGPAPDVTQILVVHKADQFITLDPLPEQYVNDPAFELTATASSGLEINYQSSNEAVASINGTTVTIIGAGTTTITAFHEGNANYNPAPGVSRTLVVNKISQTITFDELTAKTFGDSPFELTAIASSGLPVIFTGTNTSVATVSGNTVTITGAGSTIITASQPGNATYLSAAEISRTFIVNKADQAITVFEPLPNKLANDPAFQLTATLSSGLTPQYSSSNADVATVSGSTVTIIGSGTTIITAFHEGNQNYNAAPGVQRTLTVNKVAQTITFATLTAKTYGNAPFNLTATASSGLPVTYVSSDPAIATVEDPENDHIWTVTITGAGTCTLTASQPGNNIYSAAVSVSRSLIVNKASQTITFSANFSKTLLSPDFAPGATITSGLPITYTSSNTGVGIITEDNLIHVVGVGTSTITASQPGNENYNAATSRTRVLTVTQVPQVITFATIAPKTFNINSYQLTATVASGLPIEYTSANPAVAIIIGDVVMFTGVGTSVITASQSGNSIYQAAPSVARTLTVTKGIQSITFDPMEPVNSFDGLIELPAYASSSLPVTYVSSNTTIATVGNEEGYWAVTPIRPGTVNIIASQTGNVNWNAAANVPRPLVIKAHQTITFAPLPDKNRHDPAFTLSATASSGLPVTYESSDPSVASVTDNIVTIVSPGTATIIASQYGNNVYSPAPIIQQTLFIALAPPSLPSTFIEFTNVTETEMTVEFVPGNGNKRLIVVKASSAEDFLTPVDNTFYGPGTYSLGSEMTMDVEGTQAIITDLAPGTKYYVKVFEFNEEGPYTTYQTECVLSGAQKTAGNTEGLSGGRTKTSVTETQPEESEASEEKTFDVQIFGNPFDRKLTFTVESLDHSHASVILTDLSGRVIHTSQVRTNATVEIDKPMVDGVYLLKVSAGSDSRVSRVVKME
jgi:Ethanolamine utilization protein EutJ (predicted chaperonin)